MLSEFGRFFADLWSVLTQFFQMIGSNEASLELLQTYFPEAIDRVLTHPDFINMYNVMIPIGVTLVMLYLSMDLMEKIAMEQVSIETIVLTLFKVVIGAALVNNGILIFEGLNGVSTWFVDTINGALGISSNIGSIPINNPEIDAVDTMETIWGIIRFLLAVFFPPVLIASISDLLIILVFVFLIPIVAYQRAVKIGVYCLLAPFAISDTVGRGYSSMRAVKYIFNLLKAFLEYPIIYYSCYLAFQLNEADVFGTVSFSFLIVLVTVIMSPHDTIKTMIGV